MQLDQINRGIEIIDDSIAHIKEHGFFIHSYGGTGRSSCYIGTVMAVNCLEYDEERTTDFSPMLANRFMTPEQIKEAVFVLSVLDDIARPLLDSVAAERDKFFINELYPNDPFMQVGRVIEAHGFIQAGIAFAYNDDQSYMHTIPATTNKRKTVARQTEIALDMFKEARDILVKMRDAIIAEHNVEDSEVTFEDRKELVHV